MRRQIKRDCRKCDQDHQPDQEVYTISDDQLALWKQSAAPLQQKWADGVKAAGGDPVVIWKELQASLTQYKAGF